MSSKKNLLFASLVMSNDNDDPGDGFFYPIPKLMMDSSSLAYERKAVCVTCNKYVRLLICCTACKQ